MKRLISLSLVLVLLIGCTQKVISPTSEIQQTTVPQITIVPTVEPVTPAPSPAQTPQPVLPTLVPKSTVEALFPEELFSQDGEPVGSEVASLLAAEGLSKDQYYDRFYEVVHFIDTMDADLQRMADQGRTLTEDRKDRTVLALSSLMSEETLDALQTVYAQCAGEGRELPVKEYTAALSALIDHLGKMEPRTDPYFALDAANDYRTVLDRYMGEPVSPQTVFNAMEALMETEAYALGAALMMDPEAVRKKEPISYGNYAEDIAFLIRVTQELCPLPDGSDLPVPPETEAARDMDLLELGFRLYPGMAYLNAYASHGSEEQQARWANASDGYLAGLAVHCSYAVTPYLADSFGRDYVQYRWYEDMLYVTMTGMSSLLIHYYGYSSTDLAEYLKAWGAQEYTGYLYEKAMNDPFEGLVASYGYYRYLDICEACMDAGCPSETQFLRDYLAAGPAPFQELKGYMVGLYKNQG